MNDRGGPGRRPVARVFEDLPSPIRQLEPRDAQDVRESRRREAGAVQHQLRGRRRREIPAAHKILTRLADVGLGYLSLGQPLATLSGGERQRLKLAIQMSDKDGVYVLDEPTTDLITAHPTLNSKHLAAYIGT